MTKAFFISVLCLLQLAVSCGRSVEEQTLREDPETCEPIKPEIVDSVLSKQQIFCETQDSADCLPQVVKTISYNKNSQCLGFATGFLVAPNFILTNAHAVNKGDLSPEEACDAFWISAQLEWSRFRDFRTNEVIRCKKIHLREFSEAGNQDFALIELEKSLPHRPLTLDFEASFSSGQSRSIYVLDHKSANYSRLVKLECRLNSQSPHLTFLRQVNYNEILLFTQCAVIGGNSGSPILNAESQKVEGLIFAQSSKRDPKTGKKIPLNNQTALSPLKERFQTQGDGLGFPLKSQRGLKQFMHALKAPNL